MREKVVIIGASITDFYAMNELVKQKFDGKITIMDEKEVYPYNTYPLSKEWMLDTEDTSPPLLKEKEFYEKNQIDLKLGTRAEHIDWKKQTVTTDKLETIPYDHLIIATGSKLRTVSLPGDGAKGVFYLREFKDAKIIKEWAKSAEHVAIIGTGFIGLELASTFRQTGKNVSVLVRSGKPLEKILGEEVSQYFVNMHESHGVEFLFDEETEEILSDDVGNVTALRLKSGKTLKTDMVMVAVGVEPNLSFRIEDLEMDGTIPVNEYGETALPHIYAGGDIVKWPYKGRLIHVEHWETAWSQGISIAKNILKARSHAYHVDPYFWTDQFDQTFEYLGNTRTWDKTFIRGSLDDRKFAVAYVDASDHLLAILFANKFEEREDMENLMRKDAPLDEARFRDLSIPAGEL